EGSAGEGVKDRLRMIGKTARHFGARVTHARQELRIAELRNRAAKVALGETLRLVVLAGEQTVLQRREKGDAEIVLVDPGFQSARFVLVVDDVAERLHGVRIDAADELHDLARVPIGKADETDLSLVAKAPHVLQ